MAKVEKKMKAQKLVCKRCDFGSKGVLWITRPGRLALSGRTRPKRCPQCKSENWETKPSSKAAPKGKRKLAQQSLSHAINKAHSKRSALKKKATSKKPAATTSKKQATKKPRLVAPPVAEEEAAA